METLRFRFQVLHERTVDFHGGERIFVQTAQRGIASSEVVDFKIYLELSVTSILRLLGSSPVSPRMRATLATRSGSASSREEAFTLIGRGVSWGKRRCHSAICVQACRMTHRPKGTISPVSSATGRNSP